ncbi:hypothetical protein [Amycolatopsis echigonensis]|uniref:hypothetical protein n=1 Tax=Amycolatopsis echigonensis TaxID=2576905 RepID=UPI001FEA2B13|nr:hypothetical protein [Amycolatopsis echigonensis]
MKIAGALRVSLSDITGDGLEIRDPQADATIPAIRDALLSTDLDGAEPPTGDLAELQSETQLLAALRQANQDAEVGARLPDLLLSLHTHVDRPEALRSLVTATHTTTLLTKGLGAFELAWIAADRGHEAALKLGEHVWIALAEFARTQALSGLGAHKRAGKLPERALETVPADAYDVRGACKLGRFTFRAMVPAPMIPMRVRTVFICQLDSWLGYSFVDVDPPFSSGPLRS